MGHDLGPELIEKVGLTSCMDPLVATAVGSILADALIGHHSGRATSFSLNKNFYTGLHRYNPAMKYDVMRKAVAHLTDMGLIEVKKPPPWPAGQGTQSRLWATQLLLDLAGDHPVLTPRRGEVLIMKDSGKNLIGYPTTDRTIAWTRDIRAQTEALGSTEIRIEADDLNWVETGFVTVPGLPKPNGRKRQDIVLRPDQIALRRIANNSSWNEGMRYYGHWAQGIQKERRKQLTIGGMSVELLDFGASHPSILYSQVGLFLDGDPYEAPGFERGEVKLALLILINAGNKHEAVRAMAGKLAEAEADEGQKVDVRQDHQDHARRLLASVETRHEPIKDAFCTGSGTRLQAFEAEIIGAVMKAGRKQGIVTIPVHDELVVKAGREADLVRDFMVEKWVSACGAFPLL